MISKVLNDIGNVGIYPVLTLIIFFTIFSVMLIMVWFGSKSKYDRIAHLPLDPDNGKQSVQEVSHAK